MSIFKRILLLLLLNLNAGCTHLLYHPSQYLYWDPKILGITYRAVEFPSLDDVKLQGWYFPARGTTPHRGTVVQFHGNAENMTAHFSSLYWVIDHGYDFFTFDYRGYGASDGTPSPRGMHEDAVAAIHWVEKNAKRPAAEKKDLIFYGQSLGGAVLTRALEDISERSRIKAVVIESSFDDYHRISCDVLSRFWLTWPFQWLGNILVADALSPEASFAKISPIPLLVIHGDRDRVVPARFGESIYSRALAPKTIWRIRGGVHIGAMNEPSHFYREALINYLGSL